MGTRGWRLRRGICDVAGPSIPQDASREVPAGVNIPNTRTCAPLVPYFPAPFSSFILHTSYFCLCPPAAVIPSPRSGRGICFFSDSCLLSSVASRGVAQGKIAETRVRKRRPPPRRGLRLSSSSDENTADLKGSGPCYLPAQKSQSPNSTNSARAAEFQTGRPRIIQTVSMTT